MSELTPTATEPLPELAISRFSGPDVRSFLQGYLTCDADQLQPGGPALPAAMCNLKGRVVANGWAAGYADVDTILFLSHRSVAALAREFLAKYLVFAKTQVAAWEPENGIWGSLNVRVNEHNAVQLDEQRWVHFNPPTDLQESSTHHFEASLLRDRRVLVQAATSEQFLPQMLELDLWGAVDFQKGCYLGQEVVARTQHRGQLKRTLTALSYTSAMAQAPNAGTPLLDPAEKAVGTVVESLGAQYLLEQATTGAHDGSVLAVVSTAVVEAKTSLHYSADPQAAFTWLD